MLTRRSILAPTALALASLLLGPALAYASVRHPAVVTINAQDGTPQLVKTTAVPQPHVDALANVGSTMFAGGLFDTVTQGSQSYQRANLMAFDKTSGKLSTTFNATIAGGQVWALAADPDTNSLYVGGTFKSVNGVTRPALAKLNATTGQLDSAFAPVFTGGTVNDLELTHVGGAKRLVVAGTLGKKLFSLNPVTGKDDRYFTSVISDPIPGASGGVAVFSFAVSPDRTKLVATGNFTKVNGVARRGFVMMNLPTTPTPAPSVNPWYYPGFSKECAATATNDGWRIAYLRGIDWSPDGKFFNVAATGKIPASTDDIWYHRLGANNRPNTTVCDAVGRFSLADPTKPVWINYTGGDSVWSVADTGVAVYAAGHFKWLDNPDGYASLGIGDKTSGRPATYRQALGAIDPVTGLANAWDPRLSETRIGGKAFLADANGLWLGNDATKLRGEPHLGLAYVPVP